jgi:diguanylate cyclase (GGDEF)-like protein
MKRINDALGQSAGDRPLVATARRLDHAIRAEDLVARLGGDEFGVMCEASDEEYALAICVHIVQIGDASGLSSPVSVKAGEF